nr:hypothetical protein [Clostridia bacterium]
DVTISTDFFTTTFANIRYWLGRDHHAVIFGASAGGVLGLGLFLLIFFGKRRKKNEQDITAETFEKSASTGGSGKTTGKTTGKTAPKTGSTGKTGKTGGTGRTGKTGGTGKTGK